MGIIFGSTTTTEDFLSNVATTSFSETSTIMEAALGIVNDLNSDWNSLMESMLVKELSVLESTGSEMIYESFNASAFLDKIKEFFTNLWSKFTGLIKKWYTTIDDMLHDTSGFMKKYKDDFIDGAKKFPSSGISIKGFTFAGLDSAETNIKKANSMSSPENQTFERLMTAVDIGATKDNASEFIRTVKQDTGFEKMVCRELGSENGDPKTFNEDIKKFYYGDKITVIKSIDVSGIIAEVNTAQDSKKSVKSIYNGFKEAINKQIKAVNGWKKDLVKTDELISVKMACINAHLVDLRMIKTRTSTASGAILSAYAARLRQNKEIMKKVAALSKKKKDSDTAEDKALGESSTSDFESTIFGSEDL